MRWRYLVAIGFLVAIAYYSPAFNLHEVYARFAYDQGVGYDKYGEIDKAIERYDRAIERYPQFVDAYNRRGSDRRRKQDLDGAIADYGEVIRLRPEDSAGYFNRGVTLEMKGDIEAALADFGEAIRTGRAYLDRLEQNRKAMEPPAYIIAYDRGAQNLLDCYLSRGRLLVQRGEYQPALADFTAAAASVKQAGADQSASFELIRTRLLAGDFATAKRDADAFVQRFPDNAGASLLRGFIALFEANEPGRAGDDLAKAAKGGIAYYGYRRLLGYVARDEGEWFAPGVPFRPYVYNAIAWQHLTRERAGQDDREELKETLKTLGAETWGTGIRMVTGPDGRIRMAHSLSEEAQQASRAPWPGRVIDLFLGTWTPEELRADGADTKDKVDVRRRQCDVDFYVGLFRLKAAPAEARKLLQAAADNCPPDALEGVAAKFELGRLGS